MAHVVRQTSGQGDHEESWRDEKIEKWNENVTSASMMEWWQSWTWLWRSLRTCGGHADKEKSVYKNGRKALGLVQEIDVILSATATGREELLASLRIICPPCDSPAAAE